MNGVPVYPVPQNGERPYPEAPKWHFWDPCLGLFWPLLSDILSFLRLPDNDLYFNLLATLLLPHDRLRKIKEKKDE